MNPREAIALKINDQPVPAEQFYAVACDPRRSVAVEACAGAGKTWILVSRMLRALLSDDALHACQPHEILAITFTRKAAGEMRERLTEWLREFALADTPRLLQALSERGVPGLHEPERAQALCQRLKQLYPSLLAGGRSVQIRTFHGWFSSLLRTAPLALLQQLRLPVQYELLEDDSQVKVLAWRRFLTALAEQPAFRADFEALVHEHGRSQTHKALMAALDKRVEFELADAAGRVQTSVRTIAEQFERCRGLNQCVDLLDAPMETALLLEAARALQALPAPSFAEKGRQLEQALTQRDLDGVIAALLTAKGEERKFGSAGSHPALRQAQALALQLQEIVRQEQAWLHQQRMTRLTRLLIEQARALKFERGWIDMNDIEQAAVHLLSEGSLAGWVQERLDVQVRHLLIDEFQDTNPMQWRALRAWLEGYAGAARAPSVFIVGDPKQSIYRFRRAEPQVFQAAQQFISAALGGDLLSCEHTRRNARAVIDRVNEVMLEAAQHDRYPGFRPHTTASTEPGQALSLPMIGRPEQPVQTATGESVWRDSLMQPRWLPEERQRDLEAAQAARWLAELIVQRHLRCSEVMVLSRKRESLQPMQLALQRLGVPAFIGEKIALMDCCEVQDLVALMDVLSSPRHDLSLARVLRSPLFGLDSAALVPLARAARRTGRSWLALLWQTEGAPELAEPAAAPLAGAAQVLMRWRDWLGRLPPHDALQAIYDDGDVLARYAAAAPALERESVLGHLRALLEVALGHDGGRYLSPYMLVRALKAGSIAAPATVPAEAVRLLTIHGAKGLEADTVLLLDTDAQPRSAENMVVLLDWPAEQAVPQRLVFLQSESRPPACCIDLLAAEKQAREREELNALYVAMTRARQVLAVSACEPFRGGDSSWWKRLSPRMTALETNTVVQAAPEPAQAVAPGASAVLHLPVLPRLEPRVEAGADAPPLTVPARIGLAMHRLLQWGSASPSHARLAAREFRLDAQQCEQAVQAAAAIFRGACGWLWQADHLRWQGSEVELVHEGRLMRLDRLVQSRDGTWWVIDFKSHARPGERADLVAQLQDYARAVRALHAGEPVRAAFVTASGHLQEVGLDSA